jgi:dihydrofolate synthase / folylpolyglutamate synthase
MSRSLEEWLEYQQTVHPHEIDLGLERCRTVAARLDLLTPACLIISIAGTNGKGSSAALLDAILCAAGYRCGRFTSPHLVRYNERIRINGAEVDAASLCAAFERIEAARPPQSLTYFEYSTLAALDIFRQAALDIAILEVGLGGRLDAVNIMDADIALITAIDIDHVEWLGHSREQIAREKAGILRPKRPAVCADIDPPASLLAYAATHDVALICAGRDFDYHAHSTCWDWHGVYQHYSALPLPALAGVHQHRNASGVLAVCDLLQQQYNLHIPATALATGLQHLELSGRWQRLVAPFEVFADVAHNPLGAQAVAANLAALRPLDNTHALIGMMKDKDVRRTLEILKPHINTWHLCPLPTLRSASVDYLATALRSIGVDSYHIYPDVPHAYQHLLSTLDQNHRLVVLGSFFTVAAVVSLAQT